MKFVLSALLLGCSLAGAAQAEEREVLPPGVVPDHYDLSLYPDAKALKFKGKVAISIAVETATADIVLNADGLMVDRAEIDRGGQASASYDTKLQRVTLHFAKPVAVGKHVLTIAYHGDIARSTLGFFAMDYQGADGPHRTLATNLEPAEARKLFPCWDEPALKASFAVSVDAPKAQMALSNMPVKSVKSLSPTLQRVRFADTPRMSTYLFFLGIGDYERVHRTVDGVDIGVVVKQGDAAKAAYALDEAGKILHFYNGYFGVAYPLPKLDLIAAPGQIEGGSMENWGAIFYSQHHLLFDPAKSTENDRQLVFLVVAHEMAHQWFGDLVTMSWWSDLWLNEGFARWMQSFAAEQLHPDWHVSLRAAGIFERGKHEDAIPSTHPVVQSVLTAEQAGQAFDSITYDKGAAIITMMNAWLGADPFRDGLRHYMHEHAYANTMDSDFWSALQAAAGQTLLPEVARDLTRQTGVPLVSVAAGPGGLALSESRFAEDPETIAGDSPRSWHLPVAVGDSTVMLEKSATVSAALPAVVNAGQFGYMRVLYDQGSFEALAKSYAGLPAADRLGLLNDASALGLAGYAPASRALILAKALPADADPIEQQRVVALMLQLDRYYPPGPARDAFRRFALATLDPLSEHLGTEAMSGEDGNIQTLRTALLMLRGRFGDPKVLAWARRTQASAGARRTALAILASQADITALGPLLQEARDQKEPLEKQHLFEALVEVQDPAAARTLGEAILANEAPAGTMTALIGALALNQPDVMWDLVMAHIDDPALPIARSERWRLVSHIASYSPREARIAALQAYAEKEVPVEARRPFAGSAAVIRQRLHIVAKALPEIDGWLAVQKN
jgi:aminopeptidase N